MDNVREIHTTLKNHYALWCDKYDICILFTVKFLKKECKIMNFCTERSYQPISRYLYIETIKRGGEISLHKHFIKSAGFVNVNWLVVSSLSSNLMQIDICRLTTSIKIVDKKSRQSTCIKPVDNLQQTCYHQAGANAPWYTFDDSKAKKPILAAKFTSKCSCLQHIRFFTFKEKKRRKN